MLFLLVPPFNLLGMQRSLGRAVKIMNLPELNTYHQNRKSPVIICFQAMATRQPFIFVDCFCAAIRSGNPWRVPRQSRPVKKAVLTN